MSIPCFFGPRNSFLNLESCLYLCTLQHCTILCHNVQWSTVFQKTVNYRQDTCLLYDFLGQGTHFWIQNDANVYVLHTYVQFCTKTYSKQRCAQIYFQQWSDIHIFALSAQKFYSAPPRFGARWIALKVDSYVKM